MQKFRAAVIAVTLAAMFFIPMTVMGVYSEDITDEPIYEEPAVLPEKEKTEPEEPAEPAENTQEETFRIFDMETEEITEEVESTDENGQPQMAEYTAWREDCYESGHRPDRVTFTRDIAVAVKKEI